MLFPYFIQGYLSVLPALYVYDYAITAPGLIDPRPSAVVYWQLTIAIGSQCSPHPGRLSSQ